MTKDGYQAFHVPFLCEAGRMLTVQARLIPSPDSKALDQPALSNAGIPLQGAQGIAVDLDSDGMCEVVTMRQFSHADGTRCLELSVYRRNAEGRYVWAFSERVRTVVLESVRVVELNYDGQAEVLLRLHSGGVTLFRGYELLYARNGDIRSAEFEGFRVGLMQLDGGGPTEIMIGEMVGMIRSRADATYHHTIWHWTGTELNDVSDQFADYYAEIERPYHEALMRHTSDPDYRAELEKAIALTPGK